MHYRRISYRYGFVSHELEPRAGGMIRARPGGAWRPHTDLYEVPDALVVKVELGGVSEDDLQVALYDDALVLEGQRPWGKPEGVTRFHAVEIPYGPFRVEVPLPASIDAEAVAAHLEQGVLIVRLPKRPTEQ